MIKIVITNRPASSPKHAVPEVGTIGQITKYCQRIQRITNETVGPSMVYIKFKAEDLGYEGREPVFIWIHKSHFAEMV